MSSLILVNESPHVIVFHGNNGIYYVAGNRDDSIVSTSKSDILSDGAENDTFDGKDSGDYLEGGTDTDTYTFARSDGRLNRPGGCN